jgi:phosphopantothenoylcysteine decarboxylase/phosphopantothenate--cysteine ligase
VRNPDILAELSTERAQRTVIGFAAETEPDDAALLELGRAKLARKGCDYLVVNRVGWSEGFATAGNDVVIVSGPGDIVARASGTKREVADAILDLLV